jgi:hypothetical protein
MLEIELSENNILRLKKFLKSKNFKTKFEKSELWKYESGLAKYFCKLSFL